MYSLKNRYREKTKNIMSEHFHVFSSIYSRHIFVLFKSYALPKKMYELSDTYNIMKQTPLQPPHKSAMEKYGGYRCPHTFIFPISY